MYKSHSSIKFTAEEKHLTSPPFIKNAGVPGLLALPSKKVSPIKKSF
jgi:hypothetical protein